MGTRSIRNLEGEELFGPKGKEGHLWHAVDAERDAATSAGIEKMAEFMGAQQEHPDENITLEEATERYVERTEEVRKIVEGEETGEE